MSNPFFERPILNSPYGLPSQHWELDDQGQPTGCILHQRRSAKFVSPIPKPQNRKARPQQTSLLAEDNEQAYDPSPLIEELRFQIGKWRSLPSPSDCLVTPDYRPPPHPFWRSGDDFGTRDCAKPTSWVCKSV